MYNALSISKSDFVVIHDGARPLIKSRYIDNCLNSLTGFKGVSIAVKSKDTIKITDDDGIVTETTKRENTWVIQTPQVFDKKVLMDAHKMATNNPDITDDCMLLETLGYKIKLITGDYTNIKITTKEDLNIAKELILLGDD